MSGEPPVYKRLQPHSAAVSHSGVNYLPRDQAITQQQVDDSVMPLIIGEESIPFGNAAKGQRGSG